MCAKHGNQLGDHHGLCWEGLRWGEVHMHPLNPPMAGASRKVCQCMMKVQGDGT